MDLIDEIYDLEGEKAKEAVDNLAKSKGILVGPSSGAALFVSKEIAKNNPQAIIVTIFPDRGERYLYY